MSVEIAWKQNILVTDFHLLKSLLVVLGFGSQAFVCGFSRQNICSVNYVVLVGRERDIPIDDLLNRPHRDKKTTRNNIVYERPLLRIANC